MRLIIVASSYLRLFIEIYKTQVLYKTDFFLIFGYEFEIYIIIILHQRGRYI